MARGDYKPANIENESAAEETRPRTADVTFSEAGGAAVAAILHLLRLVSAELVLHHGLDIGRFEEPCLICVIGRMQIPVPCPSVQQG